MSSRGPALSRPEVHEFTEWAAAKGIALRFIEPGQPNENAFMISTVIPPAHCWSETVRATNGQRLFAQRGTDGIYFSIRES